MILLRTLTRDSRSFLWEYFAIESEKQDEIKINGWECDYFATKVMDLGTKYAKEGEWGIFLLNWLWFHIDGISV